MRAWIVVKKKTKIGKLHTTLWLLSDRRSEIKCLSTTFTHCKGLKATYLKLIANLHSSNVT